MTRLSKMPSNPTSGNMSTIPVAKLYTEYHSATAINNNGQRLSGTNMCPGLIPTIRCTTGASYVPGSYVNTPGANCSFTYACIVSYSPYDISNNSTIQSELSGWVLQTNGVYQNVTNYFWTYAPTASEITNDNVTLKAQTPTPPPVFQSSVAYPLVPQYITGDNSTDGSNYQHTFSYSQGGTTVSPSVPGTYMITLSMAFQNSNNGTYGQDQWANEYGNIMVNGSAVAMANIGSDGGAGLNGTWFVAPGVVSYTVTLGTTDTVGVRVDIHDSGHNQVVLQTWGTIYLTFLHY